MLKTLGALTAALAGVLFAFTGNEDTATAGEPPRSLVLSTAPPAIGFARMQVQPPGGGIPASPDVRAAYAAAQKLVGSSGAAYRTDGPWDAYDDPADPSPEALTEVVQQYCVGCHNDRRLTGNLSLADFDASAPYMRWETAEKMIHKLRADQMPPAGRPRPGGDTLLVLAQTLERTIDEWAEAKPTPGSRYFQRLNQPEYERAVHDLLGLQIDAAEFLPPDQKSANFDNIADAQLISPTLVTAYMNAASAVSRMAVGDPTASPRQVSFRVPPFASQRDRVEGAPIGSRGGLSAIHNFPVDGEYVFTVAFAHSLTGRLFAWEVQNEQLEISVDGERKALLDLDQWMNEGEPQGVQMETAPIHVPAGPHRISAAFVKKAEGPVDNLTSPHEWTITDRHFGDAGYGIEHVPHIKTVVLTGPFNPSGVSDSEPRRRIFTCRPADAAEEPSCAREILSRLADDAFRGRATSEDVEGLLRLYESAAVEKGFEEGIRLGLQAILANPKFTFRIEPPAGEVTSEGAYPLDDVALASRLSFFLWNLPPDDELLRVARKGDLNDNRELERQVRRMIADPRSEALATRFAAQWLRLNDLEDVHPDAFWFPDFNEQLRNAMRRETELFFFSLVQEDRPFFDLLQADYTFLNEQLAEHYDVPGVVGNHFRRVKLQDPRRHGLLGHGSVLTSTSFGNRTSIVIRGRWVLEVLLNSPPPPPPPDVPALEETKPAEPGQLLTSKARLEMHRANPSCNACHQVIDPIGIPLEIFDATGRFRTMERRDMGNEVIPLDTRSELWNGTPVRSPEELRQGLLGFPTVLVRGFTSNLMTYAIGRRVEHYDQPAIRKITAQARENDYRMSSFILGVVKSDAFRMMSPRTVAEGAQDPR